jgi:hypothetical protein
VRDGWLCLEAATTVLAGQSTLSPTSAYCVTPTVLPLQEADKHAAQPGTWRSKQNIQFCG